MGRERYDVNGKVVLVTGAARGIGYDAARRLADRGARVALLGLEPELLEERAQELGGGAFPCDVTDVDALNTAVERVVERFGGIDVAIANAGVAPFGTVAGIDPAAFERTIEVNLLGVWRTVRAVLPHVIERRGYLLNVASLAAILHAPFMAHYSATKAGVEAFSDSLRIEVAHTGTRVGVAYFAFIDTDMVRDGQKHPAAGKMTARTPISPDRPIPLAAAGKAIEQGVLRRANRVWAPRWLPAVNALRGIVQPLITAGAIRDAGLPEALRVADEVAHDAPAAHVPARGGGDRS